MGRKYNKKDRLLKAKPLTPDLLNRFFRRGLRTQSAGSWVPAAKAALRTVPKENYRKGMRENKQIFFTILLKNITVLLTKCVFCPAV